MIVGCWNVKVVRTCDRKVDGFLVRHTICSCVPRNHTRRMGGEASTVGSILKSTTFVIFPASIELLLSARFCCRLHVLGESCDTLVRPIALVRRSAELRSRSCHGSWQQNGVWLRDRGVARCRSASWKMQLMSSDSAHEFLSPLFWCRPFADEHKSVFGRKKIFCLVAWL